MDNGTVAAMGCWRAATDEWLLVRDVKYVSKRALLKMQPQVLCCVLLHNPLAHNIRLTTRLPLPSTAHALAMHAPDDDSSCTACKLHKPGCPAQSPSFERQAAHDKSSCHQHCRQPWPQSVSASIGLV